MQPFAGFYCVLAGCCFLSVPICPTLPLPRTSERHNCKSKALLADNFSHSIKLKRVTVFYLPQLLNRVFPPWGRIRYNVHHIV